MNYDATASEGSTALDQHRRVDDQRRHPQGVDVDLLEGHLGWRQSLQ